MWGEESKKRTLGIRDKQILYQKANHKCQACGKELDFTEMQTGHKTAWSKRGNTTLRNSVCLCYRCNKLQGTDSWQVFMKKLGKETDAAKSKTALKTLTISQLKFLAKENRIKVKGRIEEGLLFDRQVAPTKAQFIIALSKVTQDKIDSDLKNMPKPEKKKKRRT